MTWMTEILHRQHFNPLLFNVSWCIYKFGPRKERNRTSLWIKKSQNLKRQIFENQFKCVSCSAENTFISLCLFVDLQRQRKKNSNMLKDEIYCFTFNAKCLLHVHEYEVLLIFYPVTILDFWWRHFWLYRKLSCTVCLFVCFLYYSLWDYFALQFCWHVEQSLI